MSRAQRVDYQRHVVGFVWQQTSRNLLPFLTAADNVALPMVISSRKDRTARVGELLDLLGVAVPVGTTADGRPSSAMLLGPALHDDTVLQLAARVLDEPRTATAAPNAITDVLQEQP